MTVLDANVLLYAYNADALEYAHSWRTEREGGGASRQDLLRSLQEPDREFEFAKMCQRLALIDIAGVNVPLLVQ